MSKLIKKNLTKYIFSFMNLVRKIKEMRLYLVESENQYTFLYKCVNSFLKQNNIFKNK